MIAWLEARAWQVGAIAASAAALSLSVALVASKISEHRLTSQLAEVQASIDDPRTGYIVRLAQCRTNYETVSGELGRQNDAIKRQTEDSAKRIAEAEKSLTVAHAATAAAERRIGVLLRPLVSADTCSRVIEMDERLLESLK